jgi:hypothetical protein
MADPLFGANGEGADNFMDDGFIPTFEGEEP